MDHIRDVEIHGPVGHPLQVPNEGPDQYQNSVMEKTGPTEQIKVAARRGGKVGSQLPPREQPNLYKRGVGTYAVMIQGRHQPTIAPRSPYMGITG